MKSGGGSQNGGGDFEERWIESVEDRLNKHDQQIDRLRAFQNFVLGAGSLIGFLLGAGADHIKKWFGI